MTLSALHCWQKNCGPDPFHTVSCLSTGANLGLFTIGFVDGSSPIKILAGVSLAGITILTGRIAYLKPFSDEGKAARQIRKAAQTLQQAGDQTNNEMEMLKTKIAQFQTDLQKMLQEKEDLEKTREKNLKTIEDLTLEIQTIEQSSQESIAKLAGLLHQEEELQRQSRVTEKTRSEQNATLKILDTGIKTSTENVHGQIDRLHKANESIATENNKLQADIHELKEVIQQFKKTLDHKNHQLEQQRSQIRELEQLKKINDQLEEEIERLTRIAQRTLASREPFTETPPPAPTNQTPKPQNME